MNDHLILNLDDYLGDMAHSLVDKLFFAGVVDAGLVVDYGCADGALLKAYARMFPNTRLIGYDKNPDMVFRACTGVQNPDRLDFTDDWAEVRGIMYDQELPRGDKVLVLSSVYHEVRSYASDSEQHAFWNHVWLSGFDVVVFRDMMVSKSVDRAADPLDVARVRSRLSPEMVNEWEFLWGPIERQHSLVHLLLTQRHTLNWRRELNENYLPDYLEDFMGKIPGLYQVAYFDHYTLPFLRNATMEDLGVDLRDSTHLKMILKRRK